MVRNAALALVLLLADAAVASHSPTQRFMDKTSALHIVGRQRHRHRPESASLPLWASGLRSADESSSRVLVPADFGADPTGKADSLAAFEAVLAAAWSNPSGNFTNGLDYSAVIDLQGGTYLFSGPLVFPAAGGGGVTMRDGVIRASPNFPMAVNTSDETALLMLTAAKAGSVRIFGAMFWGFRNMWNSYLISAFWM